MSIDDLNHMIVEFDRKYPNALDDEAIEYITTSRRLKLKLFLNLCVLVPASALSLLIILANGFTVPDHPADIIMPLFFGIVAAFTLRIALSTWKTLKSGKRALNQCVLVTGITKSDLRDVRRAYRRILAWRDSRLRRYGSSSGGPSMMGGCSAGGATGKGGCGGSDGGCGGGCGGGG
ncbi:MAG: hypothetical protein AAGA21_08540 [Pseudomonadota bacterium]